MDFIKATLFRLLITIKTMEHTVNKLLLNIAISSALLLQIPTSIAAPQQNSKPAATQQNWQKANAKKPDVKPNDHKNIAKPNKPAEKTIPHNDLETLKKLAHDVPGVNIEELKKAYLHAEKKDSIIKAMTTPGEAKPWYKYREIFIIPKRIDKGVDFYLANRKTIERAASYYKVSPEIIVAIIGVETFYGANMGSYKVLDALYTLGFHYPPRAEYFSKEFANYVRLAKEQHWSYDTIKGSYAGAMGMGQFMPWSYLKWAVDFDNDGHINLFNNRDDAIGSVANYFREHEWDNHDNIIVTKVIAKDPEKAAALFTKNMQLENTVGELKALGIKFAPNINLPNNTKCRVIRLETAKDEFEFYVGFQNFYSITTYNRSPLYAMAVFQLSQLIKQGVKEKERQLAAQNKANKPGNTNKPVNKPVDKIHGNPIDKHNNKHTDKPIDKHKN